MSKERHVVKESDAAKEEGKARKKNPVGSEAEGAVTTPSI